MLHVRWLGRVPYLEALAIQEALFRHGTENHLLLLEHRHVFTHGPRADLDMNVLVDPASVGAELVSVNRGGDVTYHGPGQLVGYPIVSLPPKHGGQFGPPDENHRRSLPFDLAGTWTKPKSNLLDKVTGTTDKTAQKFILGESVIRRVADEAKAQALSRAILMTGGRHPNEGARRVTLSARCVPLRRRRRASPPSGPRGAEPERSR